MSDKQVHTAGIFHSVNFFHSDTDRIKFYSQIRTLLHDAINFVQHTFHQLTSECIIMLTQPILFRNDRCIILCMYSVTEKQEAIVI